MSEKGKEERSRSERDHFNAIASRYIQKDIFPPSRVARKLRVRQTVSGADAVELPDILEIGCGAGYASEYLAGRYRTYTGIDFSGGLVDLARSIHTGPDVHFLEADLYQFHPEKKYNLIIIIGVLHHMVDIPLSLNICRGLLKPEGIIAVNEPQDANRLIRFFRKLRSRFDDTYSSDQEELDRKELAGLFSEAGFVDVSIKPQGFFSTPFAEVMLKPLFIFLPLSLLSGWIDQFIEKVFGRILPGLSWNVIVKAKNPDK